MLWYFAQGNSRSFDSIELDEDLPCKKRELLDSYLITTSSCDNVS